MFISLFPYIPFVHLIFHHTLFIPFLRITQFVYSLIHSYFIFSISFFNVYVDVNVTKRENFSIMVHNMSLYRCRAAINNLYNPLYFLLHVTRFRYNIDNMERTAIMSLSSHHKSLYYLLSITWSRY